MPAFSLVWSFQEPVRRPREHTHLYGGFLLRASQPGSMKRGKKWWVETSHQFEGRPQNDRLSEPVWPSVWLSHVQDSRPPLHPYSPHWGILPKVPQPAGGSGTQSLAPQPTGDLHELPPQAWPTALGPPAATPAPAAREVATGHTNQKQFGRYSSATAGMLLGLTSTGRAPSYLLFIEVQFT